MPTKRKRPQDTAPPEPEPSTTTTRRATRQTAVPPPIPPTLPKTIAPAAIAKPPASQATAKAPPTHKAAAPRETPVPPPTIPTSPRRSRQRAPVPAPPGTTTQVAATADQGRTARDVNLGGESMGSLGIKEGVRLSDLVAPEITYHVPQAYTPGRLSSLVRPHGPTVPPPRLDKVPSVVTPVLPPKPRTQSATDRPPPRADRNIDKVVLGNLCFRTWYPSYYGKEVLGDASAHARSADADSKAPKKDRDHHPMLERLYVCPSCFKYAKELVAWWGHVRACERQRHIPGKKIYTHPRGRRKVMVAHDGKGPGPKRRRGDGGIRYVEEVVQDEGEWSIWEVDGEVDGNLSLFGKLFLDNKSVFFDVTFFNYFLLVYTPPPKPTTGSEPPELPPPQVTGFFSKEKMSWDNNNLACILVFPPWQRKGLGALLMGASYEISRREGILGGPEKPISDLGKKGYKRFWTGEIARWLLSLESVPGQETIVDVDECSQGTWISPDDCLVVLREMGVVEEAGVGPGKPAKEAEEVKSVEEGQLAEPVEKRPVKMVARLRVDKEVIRRYVASQRISLEKTCEEAGFVEGYAIKEEAGSEERMSE